VAHARTLFQTAASLPPAPAVKNAAAIRKKYAGQTITFEGDSNVGLGHIFDGKLAAAFTKQTGIKVNVIQQPSQSDAAYQKLARIFSSHSNAIDVAMVDVVWPAQFAPYLLDLKSYVKSQIPNWSKGAVDNDTVNGHLVAAPYFGDQGILYYRTDLLKKYGYSAPPTTWAQLTAMATKIQAGERKTNKNFYGFTFQGSAYEGLTCDALEWLASSGGGTFFNGSKANVDNPQAVAMLNMAKGWVGTISPAGVTSYTEEEARLPFDAGNVMFMRNWPYAYGDSIDPKQSKVVGKFGVAPLPHGPGGHSVGTLGGWQLAVNKYTKSPGAAAAFVSYMSGAAVSKYRAINGGYVPLVNSVRKDPQVTHKLTYFSALGKEKVVTRPSRFLGANYNRGSTYIFQDINAILRGGSTTQYLSELQQQLQRLVS
jgi:trehalose/maltose transport system substrate-binding protein